MKLHRLIFLVFLLALLPAAALGATAEDITDSCDFVPSKVPNARARYMLDDDYTTFWYLTNPDGAYIEVSAPEGVDMGGVYFQWYREIASWRVDVLIDDAWITIAEKADGYVVEYVELPEGTQRFRLCRAVDDTSIFKNCGNARIQPG